VDRVTVISACADESVQLGDNFSKWKYMYFSIQGVLQFNLFQIPFVGADVCGFSMFLGVLCVFILFSVEFLDGNTDEELCNRWMQLGAFLPFYRNHNIRGAIGQEPYRWDSVANASLSAMKIRYSLLPYWVSVICSLAVPPVNTKSVSIPYSPMRLCVGRLPFELCFLSFLMNRKSSALIASS
jgi:alpha-glucosidase